jgi:hypothetical protein
MSAVLEPLLQSPRLPLYVEELNQLLASEQAARQRFRDDLTGSEKGEFINGKLLCISPLDFVTPWFSNSSCECSIPMLTAIAVDPEHEFIEQYDLQGEHYVLNEIRRRKDVLLGLERSPSCLTAPSAAPSSLVSAFQCGPPSTRN